MAGSRTMSVVRKLRNARFDPPGDGPKEKLAWINRDEADLLRSIGGSGRRGKFGIKSYSWRDDSSSSTNGTQDGSGGTQSGGGGSSGGGGGGVGITTSNITGNKAYGPAGGNAVGMGAPGYGTPQETAATLARLRPRVQAPRPMVAAPPVPIPVMKPMVQPPAPVAPFLGPNANMINTLPQIGGTVPADMVAAVQQAQGTAPAGGFTPGYGAPGGAANPANNTNSMPGNSDPGMNYGPGTGGLQSGPGKQDLPGQTSPGYTNPDRSFPARTPATRSLQPVARPMPQRPNQVTPPGWGVPPVPSRPSLAHPGQVTPPGWGVPPDQSIVQRHLEMGRPIRNIGEWQGPPEGSFGPREPGENPITAERQPALENDIYGWTIGQSYRPKVGNKMIGRVPQDPNARPGDVYGRYDVRTRSPSPRDQRAY